MQSIDITNMSTQELDDLLSGKVSFESVHAISPGPDYKVFEDTTIYGGAAATDEVVAACCHPITGECIFKSELGVSMQVRLHNTPMATMWTVKPR